MQNVTRNKRFNPTEITGELEIESSYDYLCVAILSFEDFKEIEKGTFEYINDGKKEGWTLEAMTRRRALKDNYTRVVLKVISINEDNCLLKIAFNRKKETQFPFVFLSIMSVVIVGCGIWGLYLRTKVENAVPLPAIIFALSFPILCGLCALIWFPVIGQIDMFERSFIGQLEKKL